MKSVRDVDVKDKRVFVRVDYNLPMDEDGNITDDNRIRATLDLIDHLLERDAKIILASHLGRPKAGPDPKFSLASAARHLSTLINREVGFVTDCIGEFAEAYVNQLAGGQVLMLENLRFHPGEKANDPDFARKLAGLCDVYVNNAFAVSHRDQASVTGITRFAPVSASGFLLEKEVATYYDSVENPTRPLVAVIGGAKVSSKLAALENMLNFVDRMIIGGAMANTFLAGRGIDTKASLVEEELKETAVAIMEKAAAKGVELLLPEDLVVADRFSGDASREIVSLDAVPDGWMAMDIGPVTAEKFAKAIGDAATLVWNGPMGVFEMDAFMPGTMAVARAIAGSQAFSIVGGGDTGLAAKRCGITDKVSYVSTGGGAFLHLMEGKKLPGAAVLE